MSTQRALAQINPNYGYYRTIVNTTWLYPPADVAKGLAASTYKYTFDGTFIICPDIENLIGLYNDIFVQTTISQPVGNVGFSLGVGTMLQNFGKTIIWQAPNGNTVIKWQLVQQQTPQNVNFIPVPGDSPDLTVGYVTTYNYLGATNILDAAYVVLDG
jgi:hypothetical protein